MIDRSKFYKKPMRFGAQTLYQSWTLGKISLDHWKKFDENASSGKGFMVGEF